jgi:hypothetical protein
MRPHNPSVKLSRRGILFSATGFVSRLEKLDGLTQS